MMMIEQGNILTSTTTVPSTRRWLERSTWMNATSRPLAGT